MTREGARLADFAGDGARALALYRQLLGLFAAADPEYDEELSLARTRVTELEAEERSR